MKKSEGFRRNFALWYAIPPVGTPPVAAASPVSVRDQLDRHLRECGRHNYHLTTALGEALEQFVEVLREGGDSSDAVIAEVDHALRAIQPAFRMPADEVWKASWDAYFGLYDQLIQRAVFAYFVHAKDEPPN
jgi:hypothetical protein